MSEVPTQTSPSRLNHSRIKTRIDERFQIDEPSLFVLEGVKSACA
jgi:hypothetical protein